MKKTSLFAFCFLLILPPESAAQVGTAFTYQGRLADGAAAANGAYDLEVKLFDAATSGTQVGTTGVFEDISVTNGLFALTLDFGVSAFTGAKRWLEISVRPGASTDPHTALVPRQELTPSPNAIFSATATAATDFSGSLAGEVTGSQGSTVVSNAVAANTASAIVRRDGSGDFSAGSITLGGNLSLASPSVPGAGQILKGLNRFLHSAGSNTFLGENSGNLTMTGVLNTGSGMEALLFNTTGERNTAFGANALRVNTTGVANTASGTDSLRLNTTGGNNTASGYESLYTNSIGSNNVASGVQALLLNTTANKNVAIGVEALRNQAFNNGGTAWDSSNTAIGYQALRSNAPSSTANGTRNTAIGANSLQANTTGSRNSASGTSALQSNTTGSQNTATGHEALFSNTSGELNTAIGNNALRANTTGGGNTAAGSEAMRVNTTGANNTASGYEALYTNSAGSNNVATGVQALLLNTTAGRNVAIGVEALRNQAFNNGGAAWNSSNTAIGYSALRQNAPSSLFTGIGNTAIGANSLQNNTTGILNSASGTNALLSNTTGELNTASGSEALSANTTGSNNVATGFQALSLNTSGSNNTAVGYGAGPSSGALSNTTAIGQGAVVNASNMIRLGNSAVTVVQGQVSYTFSSDRSRKENLREVDAEAVLAKLRGLDVTSWNYIGHEPAEFRHYGPMAQDFYAAFGNDGVGRVGSETTLNSGDLMGVLMLGLKGLDRQAERDRGTIAAQAEEIAALKRQASRFAELEQRMVGLTRLLEATTRGALAGAPATAASQKER